MPVRRKRQRPRAVQRPFPDPLPPLVIHLDAIRPQDVVVRHGIEQPHGRHAIDPAAGRIPQQTLAIHAHTPRGILAPGLDHPKSNGPSPDRFPEIDIAIQVGRSGIVIGMGIVVVSQALLVAGHLSPEAIVRDVDGSRIRAFVDIDFRELSVDFLDGEPANRVRSLPDHGVDAGIVPGQGARPLRVPDPLVVDSPRIDPHGRRLGNRLQAMPQQGDAVEAGPPGAVTRGQTTREAPGIQSDPVLGRRRHHVHQQGVHLVLGAVEGDAQGTGLPARRQRQHRPPALPASMRDRPVLVALRVGRIGRIRIERRDLEKGLAAGAREGQRPDPDRALERDHDVLPQSGRLGRPQRVQPRCIAGRRSRQTEQPREIAALVDAPPRRLPRRAHGRNDLVEIKIVERGGAIEDIRAPRGDGEVQASSARGHSAQAAQPVGGSRGLDMQHATATRIAPASRARFIDRAFPGEAGKGCEAQGPSLPPGSRPAPRCCGTCANGRGFPPRPRRSRAARRSRGHTMPTGS